MDVTVRTGQTKPGSGTLLVSRSFTSHAGERVCLLLQIHAPAAEAKMLEEESLKILQHGLLQTEGDSWQRLDGALKELNGLIKGLLVSDTVHEVHALIALLEDGGALHVSTAGRSEGYLIRGGKAVQITEGVRGKPVPAFVHIASGALEGRETVVLSTQRLLRLLTPAQLAQLASQREEHLLQELVLALDGEKEDAALAVFHVGAGARQAPVAAPDRAAILPNRRARGSRQAWSLPAVAGPIGAYGTKALEWINTQLRMSTSLIPSLRERTTSFLADLKHPQRKRRAHLLLMAGALSAFLIVWAVVQLSTFSQRSKTRVELEQLMEQINTEIQTAENRRLTGDMDAVNRILQRAEERAKSVMDNESGLFRVEALHLLENIQSKREEVNNITKLQPRIAATISAKNPDVDAEGLIGVGDGEFIVYDKQNIYRVLQNFVDDPKKMTDEELLLRGTSFARYKSIVFLTNGNSIMEVIGSQPTAMKTEDPAGWVRGNDLETYLRYLYILVPEKAQIYKYERLSNRYGPAVGYNVNGDLSNALDMAIDTSIFVLRKGGKITKLLRGETQSFVMRHAPDGVLNDAVKLYKVPDGNIYFLDVVHKRVIVATDGGTTGESSYLKQYVLEGDQVGELKDLYVDPEQSHLYVLDAKHVYVIDLANK